MEPAGRSALTEREKQVVDAVTSGAPLRDVAASLGITLRTLENHLTQAYRKLGVRSRAELIAQVAQPGAGALPETRYVRVGDAAVAYQVIGDGPRDLVYVPGFVSNVEAAWQWPEHAAFLRRLGRDRRLILFDKRGTGMSDRIVDVSAMSLEDRMDDIRAVMDAAGSRSATLFGFSEGAAMSLLFAATYPERTNGVIAHGAMVSAAFHEPGSRLARILADPQGTRALYLDHWGTGQILSVAARDAAADPATLAHVARFERTGAGPGDAHAISRMNATVELGPICPAVGVPVLLLHRVQDGLVPVANARFLAEHLPYARYVELPGNEHPPWLGDDRVLWREIEAFLAADHPPPQARTVLATVVCADPPVAPAQLALLSRHRGRAASIQHGVAYAFDGPLRGLGFAWDLLGMRPDCRVGVHTGEATVTPAGLRGAAATIAHAALEAASPGDLVATRTVKDLVIGAAVTFSGAGSVSVLGTTLELYHANPRAAATAG